MSRRVKTGVMVAVCAVGLWFASLQRAWFMAEPAWRGKTVTQWLDSLALYDFRTNATGVQVVERSPESIVSDPALAALLQIGSKATPILLERVMERAQWDTNEGFVHRTKLWTQWLWNRVRYNSAERHPAPSKWPEFQWKRKEAAVFALLALGTNADAGFGRFMEAYATAPKNESVSYTPIPGPPVGVYYSQVVRLARGALPQRRAEITGDISKGLQHTNAWCRTVAAECVSAFPEQLADWKSLLFQLLQDGDEMVQETALGQLMMIVQRPELHSRISPEEIAAAARAVTTNTAASKRTRDLAEVVLGLTQKARTATKL